MFTLEKFSKTKKTVLRFYTVTQVSRKLIAGIGKTTAFASFIFHCQFEDLWNEVNSEEGEHNQGSDKLKLPAEVREQMEGVRKEFRGLFPVFADVEYFLYLDAEDKDIEQKSQEEIDTLVSFLNRKNALVVIDDFHKMVGTHKIEKEKLFSLYTTLQKMNSTKIILLGSRMV